MKKSDKRKQQKRKARVKNIARVKNKLRQKDFYRNKYPQFLYPQSSKEIEHVPGDFIIAVNEALKGVRQDDLSLFSSEQKMFFQTMKIIGFMNAIEKFYGDLSQKEKLSKTLEYGFLHGNMIFEELKNNSLIESLTEMQFLWLSNQYLLIILLLFQFLKADGIEGEQAPFVF